MDDIWTKIGGDKTSIYIYEIAIDCNIFCMIKKVKVKKFILSYNNDILELKTIHNNLQYVLTYIPDRSHNNNYLFLCKQIGGIDDLYLNLDLNSYDRVISCVFKKTKPCIIKKYHYNSYTRKYTESTNEEFLQWYELFYIDKPFNIYPPTYESIDSINNNKN